MRVGDLSLSLASTRCVGKLLGHRQSTVRQLLISCDRVISWELRCVPSCTPCSGQGWSSQDAFPLLLNHGSRRLWECGEWRPWTCTGTAGTGPPREARQQLSLSQKCYSLARGKHVWVCIPCMYLPRADQLQHVRGHARGKLMAQFCWRMMFVDFEE